jgi:hypothetical protein
MKIWTTHMMVHSVHILQERKEQSPWGCTRDLLFAAGLLVEDGRKEKK